MNAQIEIKPLPADKAVDEFLRTFPLLPRNYDLYRAALAFLFQKGVVEGANQMAESLLEALEAAAKDFESKVS